MVVLNKFSMLEKDRRGLLREVRGDHSDHEVTVGLAPFQAYGHGSCSTEDNCRGRRSWPPEPGTVLAEWGCLY